MFLAAGASTAANPLDALARADALYERYEFAQALQAYEDALAMPSAPRAVLEHSYAGIGLCAAALGRNSRATWAFVRVLAIEPMWKPPGAVSPKLLIPIDEARAYWSGRSAPSIRLVVPDSAIAGQSVPIEAELVGDAIQLADHLVMRSLQSGTSDVQLLSSNGVVRTSVPTTPASSELLVAVQAVDGAGSVVYETESKRIALVHAPKTVEVPTVDATAPPTLQKETAPLGAAFVHAAVLALGDIVSRQLGAEAGATGSPASWLDVGLSVLPGRSTGFRALLAVHPSRLPGRRLSAFIEARAGPHVGADGLFWGAGLAAGATWEAGPGRLVLAAVAEAYRAPAQILPYSLSVAGGYQLDFGF
jgi:hypothetical protein